MLPVYIYFIDRGYFLFLITKPRVKHERSCVEKEIEHVSSSHRLYKTRSISIITKDHICSTRHTNFKYVAWIVIVTEIKMDILLSSFQGESCHFLFRIISLLVLRQISIHTINWNRLTCFMDELENFVLKLARVTDDFKKRKKNRGLTTSISDEWLLYGWPGWDLLIIGVAVPSAFDEAAT